MNILVVLVFIYASFLRVIIMVICSSPPPPLLFSPGPPFYPPFHPLLLPLITWHLGKRIEILHYYTPFAFYKWKGRGLTHIDYLLCPRTYMGNLLEHTVFEEDTEYSSFCSRWLVTQGGSTTWPVTWPAPHLGMPVFSLCWLEVCGKIYVKKHISPSY